MRVLLVEDDEMLGDAVKTHVHRQGHAVDWALSCDAAEASLETAAYALGQGGALAAPDLIAMLTDCAELCQATANSMLRGSALHPVLCRACAEACDLCAAACSKPRPSVAPCR